MVLLIVAVTVSVTVSSQSSLCPASASVVSDCLSGEGKSIRQIAASTRHATCSMQVPTEGAPGASTNAMSQAGSCNRPLLAMTSRRGDYSRATGLPPGFLAVEALQPGPLPVRRQGREQEPKSLSRGWVFGFSRHSPTPARLQPSREPAGV